MGHPKSHPISSQIRLEVQVPSTLLSSLAALPLNLDLSHRGGLPETALGQQHFM